MRTQLLYTLSFVSSTIAHATLLMARPMKSQTSLALATSSIGLSGSGGQLVGSNYLKVLILVTVAAE